MPITAYHVFSSPIADGTNTQIVRPSDWNSVHNLTLNAVGSEISNAFGNAGGVSFGYDGTNITASAAGGGGIALAAGTQTATTNTVVFSNSNGISFGMSGSTRITASYTVPSTAGLLSAVNVSAGTTSNNMSAITFSNLNGVSFGLNGSVITGSVATSYRASNDAVGLNTALTAGPLAWTVNSAGISLNASSAAGTTSGFAGNLISGSMTHNTAGLNLSLNHPAWLTTAMQSNAATISNINVSAGATSANLSALTFNNGGGVTFGLTNSIITGSVVTSYRASNDAVGLNTAQTNVTWTVNSSGLSFNAAGYAGTGFSGTNATATLNSNGLQLSVAGGGVINQTGPNISAGSDSLFTSGTVTFGNAFSGSFVTSNGSVVYSNNFLTTAAQSNHSHGNPTLALTNLSGTTASASNGLTISLSAAAGGGSATLSGHFQPAIIWGTATNSAAQNSIYFMPVNVFEPMAIDCIRVPYLATFSSSATSSGSVGHTISAALYSRSAGNTGAIVTFWSTSNTFSGSYSSNVSMQYGGVIGFNNSTSYVSSSSSSAGLNVSSVVHGGRMWQLPINTTFTVGEYWLAIANSSSSAGVVGNLFRISNVMNISTSALFNALGTDVNGLRPHMFHGVGGVYSTTSGAFPASVNMTTTANPPIAGQNVQIYFLGNYKGLTY